MNTGNTQPTECLIRYSVPWIGRFYQATFAIGFIPADWYLLVFVVNFNSLFLNGPISGLDSIKYQYRSLVFNEEIYKNSGLGSVGDCYTLRGVILTDKSSYSNWKIENNAQDKSTISWAKFEWTSGELAGKSFDRLSMNIPCKLMGLSNNFTFQFDLGANLTGVYENTISSLTTQRPELKNRIGRLKSVLQFWNSNKCFKEMSIVFGNYTATNKTAYIYKNFGEAVEVENSKDTIHLGTIGADFCKDKILIIDYPKKQFAICENMPKEYQENLSEIELDGNGRVILPMKLHGKNYRIMFDNGSSIFPLITSVKNISTYSTSPDIDTIQISSWGQIHGVTGKLITDTFELAENSFSNVKVYANHSGLGIDNETDGMTGNALFWDKTIVIDFKNKKFGVR